MRPLAALLLLLLLLLQQLRGGSAVPTAPPAASGDDGADAAAAKSDHGILFLFSDEMDGRIHDPTSPQTHPPMPNLCVPTRGRPAVLCVLPPPLLLRQPQQLQLTSAAAAAAALCRGQAEAGQGRRDLYDHLLPESAVRPEPQRVDGTPTRSVPLSLSLTADCWPRSSLPALAASGCPGDNCQFHMK